MKLYRNIMEELVEEFYDDIKDRCDCCTCEQCRGDVIAYTLNHLPPQYVVSSVGASLSKAANLRYQHKTDIHTALLRAMTVVSESPRHDLNG